MSSETIAMGLPQDNKEVKTKKENDSSGPEKGSMQHTFDNLPMTSEKLALLLPSEVFGEWKDEVGFKKNYRERVKEYHPDMYKDLNENEKEIVTEAFRALVEKYEYIVKIMQDKKVFSSKEIDDIVGTFKSDNTRKSSNTKEEDKSKLSTELKDQNTNKGIILFNKKEKSINIETIETDRVDINVDTDNLTRPGSTASSSEIKGQQAERGESSFLKGLVATIEKIIKS